MISKKIDELLYEVHYAFFTCFVHVPEFMQRAIIGLCIKCRLFDFSYDLINHYYGYDELEQWNKLYKARNLWPEGYHTKQALINKMVSQLNKTN